MTFTCSFIKNLYDIWFDTFFFLLIDILSIITEYIHMVCFSIYIFYYNAVNNLIFLNIMRLYNYNYTETDID